MTLQDDGNQDRILLAGQELLFQILDFAFDVPLTWRVFASLARVIRALNPTGWSDSKSYEHWLTGVDQLALYMNAPNPDGTRWRFEFGPDGVVIGVAPPPLIEISSGGWGVRFGRLDSSDDDLSAALAALEAMVARHCAAGAGLVDDDGKWYNESAFSVLTKHGRLRRAGWYYELVPRTNRGQGVA